MKKLLFYCLFLFSFIAGIYANPALNSNRTYRVASMATGLTGSVKIDRSRETSVVVYDETITGILPEGNWIIREYRTDVYVIINADTNEYLLFVADENGSRWELSETTQGFNTRFRLEHKLHEGKSYYAIYTCVDGESDKCLTLSGNSINASSFAGEEAQYFAFIDAEDGKWINDKDVEALLDPTYIISTMSFNGNVLGFDLEQETCFLPVLDEFLNTSMSQSVLYAQEIADGEMSLKINNTLINSGDEYIFEDVEIGKEYTLQIIRMGEVLYTFPIIITEWEFSSLMFEYGMSLDAKSLIFDRNNNYFIYSLKPDEMNTSVTKTFHFISDLFEREVILEIGGTTIRSGEQYTFDDVTGREEYAFQIKREGRILGAYSIMFTALPVVEINYNHINSEVFTPGAIVVHDPSKSLPAESMNAKFRIRGNFSTMFPKRSYAVKLVDDNGEKVDKSFFGLRSDNNWILDAMFIDPGRVRNRVSTDLWNDFAVLPYYSAQEPEMRNGTRGQYVEVFINNRYWGLYCMTEKIDRKQLKLKKYQEETQNIRGLLYKGKNWSSAVLMADFGWMWGGGTWNEYDNSEEEWAGYEVKYPDLGDGEPIDWKPLRDALYWGYSSSAGQLAANIDTYFDLPVLIDYYLFMELFLMTDNHGKNVYYSIYNTDVSNKVTFTPWDLDGIWGRRWDGSRLLTVPAQDYQRFLNVNEHMENGLYKKLINGNILNFKSRLAERYLELRKTWFKPENLIQRLTEYKNLFQNSGADVREERMWDSYFMSQGDPVSISSEYEYMSQWITSRIAYLDNQYEEFLTAGSITKDDVPGLMVYPNPVVDLVTISGVNAGENISIYDAQGRLIYQEKVVDDNNITLNMSIYKTGWYIVRAGNRSEMIIKN